MATNLAETRQPSPGRRLALWVTLLVLVLAVIEASAMALFRLAIGPNARFLVWDPDLDAARRSWEADAARADPELGWPAPSAAILPPHDRTGAKINPHFPEPGQECASAYGDSFVWGEEIAHNDGWVEQMSGLIGCRVANYGISGFGTDQAYERFRRNTGDRAPLVMLGIFPENIVRNVNQYRGFLGYSPSPLGLKGRFVLRNGTFCQARVTAPWCGILLTRSHCCACCRSRDCGCGSPGVHRGAIFTTRVILPVRCR
jgi:hypothetical protein